MKLNFARRVVLSLYIVGLLIFGVFLVPLRYYKSEINVLLGYGPIYSIKQNDNKDNYYRLEKDRYYAHLLVLTSIAGSCWVLFGKDSSA